ncbi:MAG: DUF1361 domain-containing protein [Anaerolineae bacterium]|nr:DUF1361 domain-containing protein [Anaerolineae bacterium]
MSNFYNTVKSYRYRLAIFFLLGAASVFSIALYRFRGFWYNDYGFTFLVWNLFLAWIPLIAAYTAWTLSLGRKWLYIVVPVIAFVWLIFLPNAPYIITDFKHLAEPSASVPDWFDVMLLMWFSWTGMLLGVVSLYLMQDIVHREFGRWVSWIMVFVVSVLSGLGVYIGRFIRWNSWDIFADPKGIFRQFVVGAQDPSLRSIGFTVIFAGFFLFVYVTLYAFGHLLMEPVREK